MVKPKKKVNFDEICKFIQQIDTAAGVFIFKDLSKNEKLKKKEKFLALTTPTMILLTIVFVVPAIISNNNKLINLIFNVSLITIVVTLLTLLCKFVRNKESLRNLIKWCKDLYDVDKKFHAFVQATAETHLIKMENRTMKIFKWMRGAFYVDAFLATVGMALIGFCLPENVYPKFTPTLPFYLPFNNQNTWHAFVITTIAQVVLIFSGASIMIYCFGIFICVSIHVLGYLDIIEQVIEEKMKQEIFMKVIKVVEPKPSTSKLQMSVLAVVNQNMTKKNETKFNEWMQFLTEMISDVNFIVTTFGDLFSEFFLMLEFSTLTSLFMCGLIFIIVKQQYFIAVGILIWAVYFFIICFVNEKILDKFSDIKDALYDLPWYELSPKEQKNFLIMLNCDEIQKGFTAAGIHELTMERFRIVLHAGYTNLLVLRDLVMK